MAAAIAAVPAGIGDVTAPWLGEIQGVDVKPPADSDARGAMETLRDVLPERSRRLCLTLTDRASATIDEIGATEVIND